MDLAPGQTASSDSQSQKTPKRVVLILVAVVLVGGVVLFAFPEFAGRIDTNKTPSFGDANPDFVELVILRGAPTTFIVSNTASVMSVLRAGRTVQNHKCTYQGRLVLHYASGTNISVAIRPGHTNGVYEFSHGGIFQFSSAEFLSVLASEGIATNVIQFNGH